MFNSYSVKDIWAFGLTFSIFYLSFRLGIAWVQVLSFLLSPSSYLCSWAYWLGILPCHCISPAISLPLFYFLVTYGLTSWCFCHASPLFTSLPLLSLTGQHSCCASPFHSSGFFGPFTSSLTLLLPWVFIKSFALPRPNYHIFTSYYFSGLLAFKPT